MVQSRHRKFYTMPRRRKSDLTDRPNRRGWKKLSLPEATLDVLDIILTARRMDERDVHELILQAIRQLPEYPAAYKMLVEIYPDLPKPE
jgi:hypothetical protein